MIAAARRRCLEYLAGETRKNDTVKRLDAACVPTVQPQRRRVACLGGCSPITFVSGARSPTAAFCPTRR
ncbi:hypothetical protein [Streptomyces inhibens]|uniref:hypothetical protein n=1 Tax=Streptomyces inhibens TaxID=2293571 RepID=UPI000FFCC560|nr:hypothetical protein [Streptomyces inhibens]